MAGTLLDRLGIDAGYLVSFGTIVVSIVVSILWVRRRFVKALNRLIREELRPILEDIRGQVTPPPNGNGHEEPTLAQRLVSHCESDERRFALLAREHGITLPDDPGFP